MTEALVEAMTETLAGAEAGAKACESIDDVPQPQPLIKQPFEYLVWGNWISGAPLLTNHQVSQLSKSALYVSATYDLDSSGYHTQVAMLLTTDRPLSEFELASAWYNRVNGVFWNGDWAAPQPYVSSKALGDQLRELIAVNVQH